MDFALNDDNLMLRTSAEDFVDNEVDLAPLLVPGAGVESSDYRGLWEKIGELGWAGITLAEEFGGLGMSFIDLQMVVEQIGRSLAPCPYFGTLAGAWAIEAAGSAAQKGGAAAGRRGGVPDSRAGDRR